MTDHPASALLDDYLDGDLNPTEAAEIKSHLETCDRCRQEYQESYYLKELLKHQPVHHPGEDYWAENAQLILARTTETGWVDDTSHRATPVSEVRRNFVTSLVALAASIVVLFSAIYMGNGQPTGTSITTVDGRELLLTGALQERLNDDESRGEQMDMARGYLLLGAPGMHGRFAAVSAVTLTASADNR